MFGIVVGDDGGGVGDGTTGGVGDDGSAGRVVSGFCVAVAIILSG